MAVTADLKIQLLANDVVVAESDDQALWQRTLGAITGAKVTDPPPTARSAVDPFGALFSLRAEPAPDQLSEDPAEKIRALAGELEVPEDVVVGACAPGTNDPRVTLDHRYWEAFRRNQPERGRGAVAPIVLACTVLALWTKHLGLGPPSQAEGQRVLGTINLRDPNPSRGIRNCGWLQQRGPLVVINPAEYSRAVALVRAYCLKQAPVGPDFE
jgi:hypothetical protein